MASIIPKVKRVGLIGLRKFACRCLSIEHKASLTPTSECRSFADLLLRLIENIHDVSEVVAQLPKRGDGVIASSCL